jgi:hypothetical protein
MKKATANGRIQYRTISNYDEFWRLACTYGAMDAADRVLNKVDDHARENPLRNFCWWEWAIRPAGGLCVLSIYCAGATYDMEREEVLAAVKQAIKENLELHDWS